MFISYLSLQSTHTHTHAHTPTHTHEQTNKQPISCTLLKHSPNITLWWLKATVLSILGANSSLIFLSFCFVLSLRESFNIRRSEMSPWASFITSLSTPASYSVNVCMYVCMHGYVYVCMVMCMHVMVCVCG